MYGLKTKKKKHQQRKTEQQKKANKIFFFPFTHFFFQKAVLASEELKVISDILWFSPEDFLNQFLRSCTVAFRQKYEVLKEENEEKEKVIF